MAAELNSQREDQLDEVVLAYLKAVDAGETPDHQEIIARYPELKTELAAFFEDQDHANQFSMPVWGLTKDLSVATRTGGEAAPDEPLPSTTAYQPESRERYTIIRFHAGGGIGDVYLAQDGDLGRQVALKELKPKFADDPTYRARFLEEARITGQLEHPGIVPVHELTTRAGDKKPFYTMRFIKGRTLSHAIKAYHRKREAGETGPLDLRELLNVFVGVCNAVAYAHSRGVIHRDLKPQNIALGDFGEALVLDWGLAKVLGEKNGEDSLPPVSLEPEAERGETRQGSRVGTIPYMAPEQAEGRIDLMDRRTDVYGLGAILYEILTGEPPFTGPEESVVLDRVQHEAPAPARRKVAATPVALEAVCLKALAKKREDRYSSAKELAQEIERYLADEPVAAYPEPLVVRVRRWLGKHRTLATATAAAVIVATIGLATATVLLQAANTRERKAQRQTEEARKRAEKSFQKALGAVDQMLTRVGEKHLADVPQMEEKRSELLKDALVFYEGFLSEDSDDPQLRQETGRAYQRAAGIYRLLGDEVEAKKAYESGRDLQERLKADFPENPNYRLDLAITHQGLADLFHDTGRYPEAETSYKEALNLFSSLPASQFTQPVFREALAGIHHRLGDIYVETNRRREADLHIQEALKIRAELAQQQGQLPGPQQALAGCYTSLGRLQNDAGNKQAAKDAYESALDIQRHLADTHHGVPDYQINLASSYETLGRFHGFDGRIDLGLDCYQQALGLLRDLTKDHPAIPEYKNNLAKAYEGLGELYRFSGRSALAAKAFGDALDIQESLVVDYPDRFRFAMTLSSCYAELANLRKDAGSNDDFEAALPLYEKNIKILRDVLDKEPNHVEARLWLSSTYMFRAETWVRLEHPQKATQDWERMSKLAEGQSNVRLRILGALALAQMGKHVQATNEVASLMPDTETPDHNGYNIACIYSLCSQCVSKDSEILPAERRERAGRYAHRAVEILEALRQADFFKDGNAVERIEKDPDLNPLRSREDFKKLRRQVKEERK